MKLKARDAGCWIAGHWGHYGSAHVIRIAARYGYPDLQLYSIAERYLHASAFMSAELCEAVYEGAEHAERWLNENAAPDGYSFGWHEGEFFLWPDEVWRANG